MTTNPSPLFVDREQLPRYLPISERTFDALVASGDAPKPRKISKGRVAWLYRELVEWAESRPVSDHLPGPGRQAAQADQTAG